MLLCWGVVLVKCCFTYFSHDLKVTNFMEVTNTEEKDEVYQIYSVLF